jgi:hypothetical protein
VTTIGIHAYCGGHILWEYRARWWQFWRWLTATYTCDKCGTVANIVEREPKYLEG